MQPQSANYPYIVADIGGTNARFGLITGIDQQSGEFVVENQKTYASADFNNLDQVVACYLDSLGNDKPEGACLAVAGPVAGDQIKLTNLGWDFSASSVKNKLGLEKLQIINDFAAYAYATQYLDKSDLRSVKAGVGIKDAPIAIVGPGTGFGVAALVKQNGRTNILASEGGHMTLAANNPFQLAVKQEFLRKYSLVSIERVFSGGGLRDLYLAMAAVEGIEAQAWSTAQISQNALHETDMLCHRTLSLFCSWLGSVTGDLALALGARGGVFLGGGILPRIADFFVASDFAQSFQAKDHMSQYLQDIPVQLVIKNNSALLGAAAWYEDYA